MTAKLSKEQCIDQNQFSEHNINSNSEILKLTKVVLLRLIIHKLNDDKEFSQYLIST